PEGGFYSALDADSEGVEGKFYVWGFEKVQELLGGDADLFCRYYDITPGGNWEGQSILFVKTQLPQFAQEQGVEMGFLKSLLNRGRQKLMEERDLRVRPGLDDKILLSWNALMNAACSKAYAATGTEEFKMRAIQNMDFLLRHFKSGETGLYHTWKEGVGKVPAFLDDYSYLIAALIELAQVTGNTAWLIEAAQFTEQVLEGFSDSETPLFYFTHAAQTDVLIRKKEVYDGATPSGNAVMAQNLFQMAILLNKPEWHERASQMLAAMGGAALQYPTSFGVWLSLIQQNVHGTKEIAIVGNAWEPYLKEILAVYLPHKIVMASPNENEAFPLLNDKKAATETHIYLCQNYACLQPVTTPAAFKKSLQSNN
ncbi:MAG TPA: hypothetical protein VM010_03965, partial [Chitinophagaceae bacterium]|nr:hypothetical protein [Chitinophagaceae bacterium]